MAYILTENDTHTRTSLTDIEAATVQALVLVMSNKLDLYRLVGPNKEHLLHTPKLNKLFANILNLRPWDGNKISTLTRYYGIFEFSGCKFVIEFNTESSVKPLEPYSLTIHRRD